MVKKRRLQARCAAEDGDAKTVAEDDSSNDVITVRESVYFSADVESRHVLHLVRAIDEASEYALQHATWPSEARVYLYINSGGGCAFAGLSAMDHIRTNRVPVVTVADGYVASAATFLLLGGYERKSMRNAKILIHQLSTYFDGKYVDLLDEVENSKELMASFRHVYAENTKLKGSELDALLSKETHMNATRSLACGMIDEIW